LKGPTPAIDGFGYLTIIDTDCASLSDRKVLGGGLDASALFRANGFALGMLGLWGWRSSPAEAKTFASGASFRIAYRIGRSLERFSRKLRSLLNFDDPPCGTSKIRAFSLKSESQVAREERLL
jgi:hypothetical protein